MRYRSVTRQGGFTLVEAVVTIVIAAILSVGIINFIGDSVDGFTSASNRTRVAGAGRAVIDRLALELNNAVPNSMRVRPETAGTNGNQCIEFLPFEAAASALDAPTTGQGSDTFRVIQVRPSLTLASPADGYHAVLFPDSPDELYAVDDGTPPPARSGPVADLDSLAAISSDEQVVTLVERHRYPRRSLLGRLFITQEPVSFCLINNRIYRYDGYGFSEEQCAPEEVEAAAPDCLPSDARNSRHLVTNMVDNSGNGSPLTAFSVMDATQRRNAIIAIDLNFASRGDTVRLTHDTMARNVP